MAIQDLKGWIWTPEEKQWINTWKRKVQRKTKHLPKEVARLQQWGLPVLAENAAQITESFLTEATELLGLAEAATFGTYLPLSPEEAKDLLFYAYRDLWAWRRYMGHPYIQAAIRLALREQRDLKRAQKRTRTKQRRAAPADSDRPITSDEANIYLRTLLVSWEG